jgi:hypothetical protein
MSAAPAQASPSPYLIDESLDRAANYKIQTQQNRKTVDGSSREIETSKARLDHVRTDTPRQVSAELGVAASDDPHYKI